MSMLCSSSLTMGTGSGLRNQRRKAVPATSAFPFCIPVVKGSNGFSWTYPQMRFARFCDNSSSLHTICLPSSHADVIASVLQMD